MSMQSLVDDLKNRAGSMASGLTDDILEEYLTSAVNRFSPSKISALETLTGQESQAILLSAHAGVCYRIASDNVHNFKMSSKEATTEAQQIGSNALSLANSLNKELDNLLRETGVGGAYSIEVATVSRTDIYNGIIPFNSAIEDPAPPSGFGSRTEGQDVFLYWDRYRNSPFTGYHLFYSTSPNIVRDGYKNQHFTRVRNDAKKFRTFISRSDTGLRVSSLPSGTYYFVLCVEGVRLSFAFSEEITVVIP